MLRNIGHGFTSGFSSDDFVTDQQVLEFMTPHHPLDLKGIATRCDGYQIGFVHFKQSRAGQVEICGGVKPEILNRGLDFSVSFSPIDFYFKTYPCDEILAPYISITNVLARWTLKLVLLIRALSRMMCVTLTFLFSRVSLFTRTAS